MTTTPAAPAAAAQTRGQAKSLVQNSFAEAWKAQQEGRKICYAFVLGPAELLRAFDMHLIYPEISSANMAAKKSSLPFIRKAEDYGYSADTCSYVTADVGLYLSGNEHPLGNFPPPDLVVNDTLCNTYFKWTEVIHDFWKCPVFTIDHPVRVRRDGGYPYDIEQVYQEDKRYIIAQLHELIADCERITGRKFDENKFLANLELGNRMAALWCEIIDKTRHTPTPFDAVLDGYGYMGGMNTHKGTPEGVAYLESVKAELDARIAAGVGAVPEERFRLLWMSAPCYPYFRKIPEMFKKWGASFVYTPQFMQGTRGTYRPKLYDLDRPFESYAETMLDYFHGRNKRQAPQWSMGWWGGKDDVANQLDLIEHFKADAIVYHAIKSCRLNSGGIADLREHVGRAGVPILMLESDIADPRYFSEAQVRNRIEAFMEALNEKKYHRAPATTSATAAAG
jgi:benzoyl-CoA reductase/2-hydroxyglutaryl-CoA dehydratase subunit BcrC/BadD/HgdB